MSHRRLITAALLIAPSLLFAQRSGRTQADKRTELMDKQEMPKGPDIRVRDLEDQSPLHLLIDKRKDLKLTDAQLSQLKDSEDKLKDKNASLFKSADTLIRQMRLKSDASDQDRARERVARGSFMDLVKELSDNYDAAAKDAVALLDADQQSKAKDMLEKQKADSEKFFRERLSGGRR